MRISWTRRTLLCFFFYNYFCLKLEDVCVVCAPSVYPYPWDTRECPRLLYRTSSSPYTIRRPISTIIIIIIAIPIIIVVVVIRDQRSAAVCVPEKTTRESDYGYDYGCDYGYIGERSRIRPDKHYRISGAEDYNYKSSKRNSSSRSGSRS